MRFSIKRNMFTSLALAGVLVVPLSLAAADKTSGKAYLGIGVEAKSKEANFPGLLLGNVNPDGPAGKAGLKDQDRLMMADKKEVKSFEDLLKVLANHKPGDKVEVKVLREGKEHIMTVTLGDKPVRQGIVMPPVHIARTFLGVQSQSLTPGLKEHLGVTIDKGALVTSVLPDSPASKAGLHEEDVITHVGGLAVNNPEELRAAIQKTGTGREALLKVVRGKQELEVKAMLQETPAGGHLQDGNLEIPGGFEHLFGKELPLFNDRDRVPALEKKVQELEIRLHDLEQKGKK